MVNANVLKTNILGTIIAIVNIDAKKIISFTEKSLNNDNLL